ncbi:MAG TPA: sulfatase [Tepidisphaeraceae bacterium]|jgi:arylsulfatase A-like enzyme
MRITTALIVCVACWFAVFAGVARGQNERPPNVVLVYVDDMGYGDLSCYGSKGAQTPNIDRLAKEGVRFTDFYVAQAVCSASRAALLTGCYNVRVGIFGALGPNAKIGLNPNEFTLPRLFKSKGYATAAFGKWHLGSLPQFMPWNQGFDRYAGLPYSNDMWPRHPETPKAYPPLPLYEQDKVIQTNPDMDTLTGFYTEHAVKFIDQNKDRPFFLYVPHSMPHVPLGAGPMFKGKSGFGLYGDVMMELDWSVGQICEALRRNHLEESTLVMFASDNGPWTTYGDHAGSSGGLREAKATSFEGGIREPFIARWPGHIPAGSVCHEPAMTIDLLPTFAKLLNVEPPSDRKIDGKDIWPLISAQPGAKCPHEAYFIYWVDHLEAVRSGKWKLHFPHDYRETPKVRAHGGIPTKAGKGHIELSLFDLEKDPGETTDVSKEHADVVKHLEQLADEMRKDLGDSATKQKGTGRREPGRATTAPTK